MVRFLSRTTLKEYDYFRKQKDAAFDGTLSTMKLIVDQTTEFYRMHRCASAEQLQDFFYKMLRVSDHQSVFVNVRVIEKSP